MAVVDFGCEIERTNILCANFDQHCYLGLLYSLVGSELQDARSLVDAQRLVQELGAVTLGFINDETVRLYHALCGIA